MTGYGVTTTPHPLPLDDAGRAAWDAYEDAALIAADAYETRRTWLDVASVCRPCGLMGHGLLCWDCRREGAT